MSDNNSIQAYAAPSGLAMTIGQAVDRYNAVVEFTRTVMKPDKDYGIIPGTGAKPTLLKPGAEKLCSLFGFVPQFVKTDSIIDFDKGLFYLEYRCELWRNGALVATGIGSCNSHETKYRYRKAERVCPACGASTIIKGKAEYGGGWLCFAKKGGCNAKFSDHDPAIVGQETGQIKNPDVADLANTILKMADKRALVAATLIATGLSEYFTQDIEDFVTGEFTEITTPKNPAKTVKPENVNQETGEITDAVELVETMGSWAVEQASTAWAIPAPDAAKKIAAMKLGKRISKADFLEIVKQG